MKAELTETLTQFWDERNSREKLLLGWGGALLVAVVLYSVLWSPAAASSSVRPGSVVVNSAPRSTNSPPST